MRIALLLGLTLLLWLPFGCDDEGDGDGDSDSDVDADSDVDGDGGGDGGDGGGDADVDADVDADSDTDVDADSDVDNLGQCTSGPDCLTERDEWAAALATHRNELCPSDQLTRDTRLDAVAQERSVAMATYGTFTPTPEQVRSLRDRLHIHIEDITMGFHGGENTARSSTIAGLETIVWEYEEDGVFPMRERLGDCEYELVGIGIAADSEGRFWGTQTFFHY